MKLEHVALYVNDLERAREFFMKYFDATSNAGYHISFLGVYHETENEVALTTPITATSSCISSSLNAS